MEQQSLQTNWTASFVEEQAATTFNATTTGLTTLKKINNTATIPKHGLYSDNNQFDFLGFIL